ncbi:DUF1499 domain-containing protein [Erythrobacter sp. EC-HK427]|uniref:DUF1499 domain-containing protein n=1 Tax=Erythrobacter sp. EC-HK427 TaxID=2038396 RepID=UPI00125B4743|nr:DUF1499 domain-containing protein [Erythrobacter sp. EC-HK427]VVT11929.1 conserved membrane hypothetical protein [Erythrobacter sp. EC-HK427]
MADTPENTTPEATTHDTTSPEATTAGIQPDASATEAVAPELAAQGPSKLTRWIGNFTHGGAVIMLVIAFGSLVLARYDIIDKLSGFRGFMMTMYPFAALAVIAVIGIAIGMLRKRGAGWRNPLALVLSVVMLGVFYTQVIAPARSAPFMHDISTDVDDPPAFQTLTLREDNLDVHDGDIEAWRSAHRESYPNIEPVIINKSPELVIADAHALAEARGWEIAEYSPAAGRLEATATAGFIRFYDDVIVEATPIADGSTRVDMRSVSRVGGSDLGYNAARIEAFLNDLRASN